MKLVTSGLVLILTTAACSQRQPDTEAQDSAKALVAQVASYDLAAGEKTRFIVGLLKENKPISSGQARMRVTYLDGDKDRPGPTATGRFLPIPKGSDEHHTGTEGETLPEGVGAYAGEVTFDRAGYWQVEVSILGEGAPQESAKAVSQALEKHKVPAVGDDAPRSENLTVYSTDAPKIAIDSRASDTDPVPDPELHQTTIKRALEQRRPVLAVFSTPTFCVSRFCGPITDMVQDLSKTYSQKAGFIHVEIWRDRQSNTINQAAAEWLYRDGDLQEPWSSSSAPMARSLRAGTMLLPLERSNRVSRNSRGRVNLAQ